MAESKLRELSTDFAVKIIKLCETIKGHYSLVNQLERSATSIGANIHEANYAHEKPNFIAKLQIALKECYETEYWLELFVKSDILNRETAIDLYNQCGTIRRILIASINTAKENVNEEQTDRHRYHSRCFSNTAGNFCCIMELGVVFRYRHGIAELRHCSSMDTYSFVATLAY